MEKKTKTRKIKQKGKMETKINLFHRKVKSSKKALTFDF
jgi:hypothetical protein